MIKKLCTKKLFTRKLFDKKTVKKLLMTGLVVGCLMISVGCGGNGSNENQTTNQNAQNNGSTNNTQPNNNGSGNMLERPTGPKIFTAEQKDIYEEYEGYTIKKMYKKMISDTSVNARKGPATTYERIDIIEMNTPVSVIGQCEDTGWYMVLCSEGIGFVSNIYYTQEYDEGTIILGDECPYYLYKKTEYNGQVGWFYRPEIGWQCEEYEKVRQEIASEGYGVEYFPVYMGNWRDSGDVMWIGYGKE